MLMISVIFTFFDVQFGANFEFPSVKVQKQLTDSMVVTVGFFKFNS